MFTGIIESLGQVRDVYTRDGSVFLRIQKPAAWKMKTGGSVSVDGICSTVTGQRGNSFELEYMPETLKKTTAKFFQPGRLLNLERSLRLNDRLDGHLVQGHVDTIGVIQQVRPADRSVILKIGFPNRYRRLIAEKGAIAVNGVSLTVVNTASNWFSVALVSYTLRETNLSNLKKGDKVNLEVDIIARYLQAWLKMRSNAKKK